MIYRAAILLLVLAMPGCGYFTRHGIWHPEFWKNVL